MALGDYRKCDVCGDKAFYDANLNYDEGCYSEWHYPYRTAGIEQHSEKKEQMRLDYLGDWAVICSDCAKTHKTVVVPISSTTTEGGR